MDYAEDKMRVRGNKKKKAVSKTLMAPTDLADKEKITRVTINLSQRSVKYFKTLAQKHQVPYQRLMRRLLDDYSRQAKSSQ